MIVAGVVALALALNGTAATGVALIDEPQPTPSLSEQVQQDDVTTSVEVTDEASPESSSSPADEASDEPTDLASDSASPSEEASSSGAPSETATAEDVDGATESPSAAATEDVSEPPVEGSSDPEVVVDEAEAPAEPAVGPDARSAIAPLAAGDSTIRVRKAGVRSGNASTQGASGLQGAVFEAYADGTSQTQAYDPAKLVATCTTDAAGNCDLKVDSELGPRYVVVEKSAPDGWRKIDQIALGAFNASGTPRDYRWNVGVTSGGTTIVPQTEIQNVSGQNSWRDRPRSPSTPPYQWADALNNVPLPAAKCGLKVAMLFDQSGSIGSNLPLVKDAAKQFVDDLTGTPTSIALFTFSTDSPQNGGGSQNRPDLVSIADPAGANQVKGYIDGFSAANGGTNWDAGLRRVANASQQYDVLIVLTDGNPTAWEGEKSSTGDVDDYDVENAIHSANWVKSEGTRIVAVGFSGQDNGLNALNLTTISGTVEDDDYYLTTFGDLDDVLTEIALNGCGGTINVQKKIAPTWTGIDSVDLEPNWAFERAPDQDWVSPQSGTTGSNGSPLEFRVTLEQGELFRDVTITEPDLKSFTPLPDPVTGLNARCTITGSVDPRTRVVNDGNGVTVENVTDKEIISCLFVNSPARLAALKYQDTNANSVRDVGEPGLRGWTLFLDESGNSVLDAGETSAVTDAQGEVLFDRLAAPKEYRVCEVQKSGWFNTDPGGGVLCKTQQVDLQGEGDPPAGPVLFGNVQAGGFTVKKEVVDTGNFVADDLEFTINVACTFNGQPVSGYPKSLTLANGESATLGPLFNGTTCTVTETGANGAVVTGVPRTVSIPTDDGVTVTVTNTYPVGFGEVVKVVNGDLAEELAPEGTKFEVAVTCRFPAGHPSGPGPVPGYNPTVIIVESGDNSPAGEPGPPTQFGPLPVGTTCTATETDDNGADPSSIAPSSVTIREGAASAQTRFTATNTYNPAAVKVLKKVEPAGIVPDDTEFMARVDCWFRSNPATDPPDRSESVTFSVDQPGVVSNLPLNSQCRVTETDTNGASAVVAPAGLFPVNQNPVEVTITNTFPTGQLTVEKVVTDPSGLVAAGTQYTINVACTFDGNDLLPRDVVLTYDTDLSETLTGIPYGTTCTLTEQDLNGAGSVTFEPGGGTSATVTIGPDPNDDVTVTATNDYPAGTFPIRKSVIGPGAGFVPAGTEFEVTVTCTLPADFPGTDPAPYVVTIEGGQTIIVPTAPDTPLPVGTTCTVVETGNAGAGSSVVLPDEVEIENEGAQNVEVVVTNTYPAGTFTVRKLVDGPGRTWVPPLTDFEVKVTCSFPRGFPDQGVIPGYDQKVITIDSGSRKGVPGVPVTVGPLPVGSQCTLVETPNGTDDITYDPSDTVTVPDATADPPQDPVNVLITNTYPVGTGEVVKVVDGALAEALAPAGTVFLVEVECTFPADFPGADPDPEPIPGFDPLELAVESAGPGGTAIPVPFGPVPVGSECIVTETETGGADPVTVDPPTEPASNQSAPVIITKGPQDPVSVTFTNTFNPAALVINKKVTGPGAALLPDEAIFKALVECTYPNTPAGQIDFTQEVEFSVAQPGAVTGLPVGSVCTVTETQTNGAPVPPAQVVTLNPPPDPVLVEITFENVIPAGELVVEKVLGGEAAGVVPDGVEFTVGVVCSYQGTSLAGYPAELVFTTPDKLTDTLGPLPLGSECYVTESDDGGATSVEFNPPGPVGTGQSGVVEIDEENPQEPITVQVENIYDPAVLIINKAVGPDGVLIPPGQLFTALVKCTFEGESIYSGDVPFGVGSPGVVSGLIVGAECTITESESQGAAFDPSSQIVTIEDPDVGDGEVVTVEVTITNTFETGSLTVEKAVDDGGTGLVPTDTPYVIDVACTFAGVAVPGYPTSVTVTPAGGPVDLPGLLAVGTECTLSEPDLNGASSVTFTPADTVEITAETPDIEVVATNVYPAGDFPITKVVDGPGASAVPPSTQFTVEVSCTFPDGFPAQGVIPGYSPKVVTLTPGQTATVGPLPAGSQCGIKETGTGGAQKVSVSPDTVTVGDGTSVAVRVTNTFPAPPNPPTVAGETCDPNKPGAQLPGSITIPPNPDFAYAINGVPYAAGTYPFPAGTYQVTAQRIQAPPAGRIAQLALESFSWTVTVPGSDVCPVLDKSADPPSGETVFTGDLVAYTITVKNGGDEAVVNETLVDQLPEGTKLDESTIDPAGGVYDDAAGTITWKFSLAAGASATFSYTVEVVTDEGTINNSVSWVERNLIGRTEHPVEPGITENITEKPPAEKPPAAGLTDTGADVAGVGAAGLLAMVIGGLMVAFGRRRRQEQ